MKQFLSVPLTALLLAACTEEAPKTAPAGDNAPPAQATMDEHGEKKPLGNLTVGSHTFAVVQYGDIAAGKEAVLDLDFPAGAALPPTVRAWVGLESGAGSMKARLAREGDRTVHGHVQVPKPVPEASAIWIEIEDGQKTSRGSIAWK
jgi:hypothetical protein